MGSEGAATGKVISRGEVKVDEAAVSAVDVGVDVHEEELAVEGEFRAVPTASGGARTTSLLTLSVGAASN